MTDKPLRTIQGHSAKEPTAVTLRSIREILAEAGVDADAMLVRKSAKAPETEAVEAAPEPAPPAPQSQPPLVAPAQQGPEPDNIAKAGLSGMLKARLFGTAKR